MRIGGLDEPGVADVLEEQIRLAGKPDGADHDVRAAAPHERPLRADDRVPRRVHVARDVEVEVAVAVGVEECAAGAPAAGGDPRPHRDLFERAVPAVAEQRVGTPVRDVEIEAAVAVEIPGARAAPPGREVHARMLRHVLELPATEVAVERVAMRDTLPAGRELGACDQVDVEETVAVVVEQRDAAAGRFENVVLGRAAAIDLSGQLRSFLECHRHRRAVVRRVRRRRPHRRRMPTVCWLLRLRLAVAPLESQAERDVLFEASLHLVEERQDGGRCRRDALEVARGKRRELRGGAPEILAQCRIEVGFPQCCYAAAGIEERLLDLIGCRSFAPCLLQLRAPPRAADRGGGGVPGRRRER